MRRVSMIALATLVALIAAPAFAVNITLNDGGISSIRSSAYDGADTSDNNTYIPTSLPDSGTVDAETSPPDEGGSSTTTGYTLSNAGFEFTFVHARTGTDSAYSESQGSLYFTADANSGYVLEGVYAAIDANGWRTAMEVRLYDQTAADYLFRNIQRSDATPNESFTLGLEDGDLSPVLVGSLTGNLLAGHQYQLYFRIYIWNTANEDTTPATASGTLSLTFVPEFTACQDGIDNDGDGFTDFVAGDPGCAGPEDLSENDPRLLCDDGVDNDEDELVDYPNDPGCFNPSWFSENPQCQDGVDNDANGKIDHDGGLSALGYVAAAPDPNCAGQPWQDYEYAIWTVPRWISCGLGAELALLLPPLMWMWRRRWA